MAVKDNITKPDASESIDSWSRSKDQGKYPNRLKLTLVKPERGKMTTGSPYYLNGKLVGYLVAV